MAQEWIVLVGTLAYAAFYGLASSMHFKSPEREQLEIIVPPIFPSPSLCVLITGIWEAAGAAALLVPAWRSAGFFSLFWLTLTVTPANIYMLTHDRMLFGKHYPLRFRVVRLFVQVFFLWSLRKLGQMAAAAPEPLKAPVKSE